jgi:hypothetical protein
MIQIEAILEKNNKIYLQTYQYVQQQATIDIFITASQLLFSHAGHLQLAWTALMNNKLSLTLLEPNELTNLFLRLRLIAEAQSSKLGLATPIDLLQMPASFTFSGLSIRVLVHVPLISSDMTLYEYIPVPIHLRDLYVHLLPTTDALLIISHDNTLHTEITRHALANHCSNQGTVYICESIGVLFQDLSMSCLGSLYSANIDTAAKLCTAHVIHSNLFVRLFQHNNFLVHARFPIKALRTCRNGRGSISSLQTSSLMIDSGTTTIIIPATCTITAGGILMRPSSVNTISHRVNHTVNWPAAVLLPNVSSPENLTVLINSLHTPALSSDIADILARNTDDHYQPDTSSGNLTLMVAIAMSIALLLLILSLAIYFKLYLLCIGKLQAKETNEPDADVASSDITPPATAPVYPTLTT